MKKYYVISLAALLVVGIAFTQLSFFVVPPIGAIPEGKTVLITRAPSMKFIDSPDAMCQRILGGVSLLCRGSVMVAVVNNNTILLRLPYSETLFNIAAE